MARFMDVHSGMKGVTREQFADAHRKDQQIEGRSNVRFLKAWADPTSGKAFCLSEGPSKEAVLEVHERAGHPTTEIYEVAVEIE